MNWERLKERIKRHEGLRLKPYKDTTGKLTIGYGRNLEDVGITEKEAEFLLDEDIRRAYVQYLTGIPHNVQRMLTEEGEEVLVEMIFQMGLSKVLGFQKTLKAIAEGDAETAYKEMLDSRWARQCPNRAKELAEIMRERGIRGGRK